MVGSKKDYFLVSIIGFFFALFLLPILKNVQVPFWTFSAVNVTALILFFVIFSNIALRVADYFGRKTFLVWQFSKFGAVGSLGAALDFGILNILIFLTGTATGIHFSFFKGISFILANTNGFFWNKYLTFSFNGALNIKEYGKYFLVGVIGFGINVGIASLVVNAMGPIGEIGPAMWANVGAVIAGVFSMVWNFWGYKFIVF